MKNFSVLIGTLLMIGANNLFGQTFPQWGALPIGKYAVGYKDTVIFKTDEQFTFYSYKSDKPIFVSIWYPAANDPSVPFMNYKDYLSFPTHDRYKQLYDSLIKMYHKNIIKYGVSINIKPDTKARKFDEAQNTLYRDILNSRVLAQRNLPAINQKFPCIFYHHGAQSFAFDNNVFCEYMASMGYVVVSANYNLPDEKKVSSLKVATDDRFNSLTDFAFVLKIAKQMPHVDTTRMLTAGHSWGAQVELLYDNSTVSKTFKQIISFHTTLEDKDLEMAKKYWPNFYYLFNNECKQSTTPTTFFAPLNLNVRSKRDSITDMDVIVSTNMVAPEFIPFRNNTTTPYTFVTVNHNVTHDGFISLGNIRFPYREKYKLEDLQEIVKQQYYYEQIILLAHKIAESSLTRSMVPKDIYNNDKFITEFVNITR